MNGVRGREGVVIPQHWGSVLLRGICAVLFGLLILDWPGGLIVFIVYLFGACALVSGLFSLFTGFSPRAEGKRTLLLLQGAIGVILGIFVFRQPEITTLVLILLIAIWAILTGAFELALSFKLPAGTPGRGLIGLSGALSALFGILVLSHPLAGIFAVILIIGLYAIVGGILLVLLSFGLRSRLKEARA